MRLRAALSQLAEAIVTYRRAVCFVVVGIALAVPLPGIAALGIGALMILALTDPA